MFTSDDLDDESNQIVGMDTQKWQLIYCGLKMNLRTNFFCLRTLFFSLRTQFFSNQSLRINNSNVEINSTRIV
jgi:hypothetical protein